MHRSLPERPDLGQLRRQAKQLRAAAAAGDPTATARLAAQLGRQPEKFTLSAAQLVIAWEHGFPSWPRLKAAVDARTMDLAEKVEAFLVASVYGPAWRARLLLDSEPALAAADLRTAAVLGDVPRFTRLLVADPGAALRPDEGRGWPPLLYVCHSHWHRISTRTVRRVALADRSLRALPHAIVRHCGIEVIEALLDAGADPDEPGRDGRSPYRMAVRRGRLDIAGALLRRGAVDDTTDIDRFLGACMRADESTARHLLAVSPGLLDRLSPEDHGQLGFAAEYAGPAEVELMLDLGFAVNAVDPQGGTALHAAAYTGRADLVGSAAPARRRCLGDRPALWRHAAGVGERWQRGVGG